MLSMSNLGTIVSALSVLIAFFALLLSYRTTRRRDDRERSESASQLTRIEAALESVREGVNEIKIQAKEHQMQIGKVTERVTRLEEVTKGGQRRIEIIEGRIDNEREDKECH